MESANKLERLVSETEDLLDEIEGEDSPQLDNIRDRLQASLKRTKSLLADQRSTGQRVKVLDVAASVNEYVREYPWLALVTGMLVVATLGILSTRATRRSYSND